MSASRSSLVGVVDEFFGVATHPLAVHAPLVLIPLLTIASVVALARPTWRSKATVPLAALSFVMLLMLFLAKESGESLLDSDSVFLNGTQAMISRHEDLANQTFVFGVVWFLLAAAAAIAQYAARRTATSATASTSSLGGSQLVLVLNVLAAIAAVVTTIWLIRAGHAGAESRWVV